MHTDPNDETDVAPGWLVVMSHPHKEAIACANLARQMFDVYCPRVRKTVRHARRVSIVPRPLFPGYLFVALPERGERWQPIHSTFGVRGIVGGAARPGLLSGSFVEGLKAREVDGVVVRPASPFKRGQSVRMTSGAFDGLLATILDLDEKGRITVLLGLLNQTIKVHTGMESVREI